VASHLPNLARRPEVEFAAVARLGAAPLARIQRRFGFQAASEDYRDVLRAGVDICLVSSPAGLHHEHAKAAMEAGADVLVEKPFTIASADAWDLVDTADRLGRHLVVAFGWNYVPMVREFKEALDAHGGIGRLEQLAIRMSSSTRELLSGHATYPDAAADQRPDSSTWTDPSLSGGGYGQAQLSHALALAMWLLEDLRGEAAFALMSPPAGVQVEFHDAIALRFRGGAIGTLSGGSSHEGAHGNKHQLEIRAIGDEGEMQIDLGRELAALWRDGGKVDIRLPVTDRSGSYDCAGPPNALVDLALGRAAENRSPGDLGARTVELLEAAYRSARSGKLEPTRT
jgi:predicted dehydrogenase